MTPEQIERTMQFILEQQAQFAANIQIHDERLARIEQGLVRHDQAIAALTTRLDAVTTRLEAVTTRLDAATDLVGRLAQAGITLDSKMAELAAAQKETTERLNAFIVFVEKYISSRNGGRAPAEET